MRYSSSTLSLPVVSEWNAISELLIKGLAIDGATAARKAFLAGVDMDMVSSLYHDNLQALVSSRQIPPAAIDDAVRHVLAGHQELVNVALSSEGRVAASILGDEAMHWAVLRNALGEPPVPAAFMA